GKNTAAFLLFVPNLLMPFLAKSLVVQPLGGSMRKNARSSSHNFAAAAITDTSTLPLRLYGGMQRTLKMSAFFKANNPRHAAFLRAPMKSVLRSDLPDVV